MRNTAVILARTNENFPGYFGGFSFFSPNVRRGRDNVKSSRQYRSPWSFAKRAGLAVSMHTPRARETNLSEWPQN